MNIRIRFPEGKRVDADFGSRVVHTDQSAEHGGAGSAPEPFELFLASIGTCAGLYVLAFCQARGIPTAGVELVQCNRFDESTHILERIELDVILPANFPDKYRAAVVRAAEGCKVKRALASPPQIVVAAKSAAAESAA